MRRISTPTAAQDLFGPGKHGFRDGDPANAILATRLQAAWFNALQEEVASVIEAAGFALEPGNNAQLSAAIGKMIVDNTIDTLNTARINVASASTVNLTESAPATRHINITGTTTINGFTVTVGRCYFVRFAGALTLTNSANLVTQTGANIVTEAGDTCILRGLGGGSVEILAYTRSAPAAIGFGQSWQDVTAQRALSTTYTNTTKRPIVVKVSVQVSSSSGGSVGMQVGGQTISRGTQCYLGGAPSSNESVVLPGQTYSAFMNTGTGSVQTWWELR